MFYTYRQNNSGGSFDINDEVTLYVIIEADSADNADEIAETKGIYFYGIEAGSDCSCCGDRWSTQWADDGTVVPEIYGENIKLYKDMTWLKSGEPLVHVYFADNTKYTKYAE